MFARSVRANRRCSSWSALRTPDVDPAARSAYQRACDSSASSASPASAIASSANARMLSSNR